MSITTTADRARRIGSADASIITGDAPYKSQTPVRLQCKILGKTTGLDPDDEETQAMRAGTLAEPIIAKLFEEATGLTLHEAPDDAYRHAEHEFLSAHPDYITTDGDGEALVELKLVGFRMAARWPESGDEHNLPGYILAQVHHQLACCSWAKKVYVGALIGTELRVYEVLRNERIITELVESEVDWWLRHIINQEPAPPVNPQECGILWPRPDEVRAPVVLDDDQLDIARKYMELGSLMSTAKKERDKLQQQLLVAIGEGEATELWHDGVPLFRWETRKEVDVESLIKSHPECTEEFMETKLRVTEFKKAHPKLHASFGKPGEKRYLTPLKGGKELVKA